VVGGGRGGRGRGGAGSLPTVELPVSRCGSPRPGSRRGALRARGGDAVFTTVADGHVHLHVRTLLPDDDAALLAALSFAAATRS
jgi:hypothetical protein